VSNAEGFRQDLFTKILHESKVIKKLKFSAASVLYFPVISREKLPLSPINIVIFESFLQQL